MYVFLYLFFQSKSNIFLQASWIAYFQVPGLNKAARSESKTSDRTRAETESSISTGRKAGLSVSHQLCNRPLTQLNKIFESTYNYTPHSWYLERWFPKQKWSGSDHHHQNLTCQTKDVMSLSSTYTSTI